MTVAIFLGALIGTMAPVIPIAFALLATGVALMWHLNMFDGQILAQNVINGADSFPLLAVPFFMLAGEIMNVGGLSKRIVNFALALVGHIKGGLGYVTIMSACALSALSGSAVADAAALTALLLPMMVNAGHDKSRAGGLIAASGVIGPVIPPSIGFVIFGVAANVSISKLFLAGIVPGLLIGAALWSTWWWFGRNEKIAVPPRKSAVDIWRAARESTWALLLPVIILVGLRFGIFTPTEAAVVAAVDGQENPFSVILANKFAEVQKYLTVTNHQYNPQSMIFSRKVWDTLTNDEKKVLSEAAVEAGKFQRQVSRDAASGTLDQLKKAGMQVSEFSSTEQAKLRDKLKPVIDKHGAARGDTVKELIAELGKVRK